MSPNVAPPPVVRLQVERQTTSSSDLRADLKALFNDRITPQDFILVDAVHQGPRLANDPFLAATHENSSVHAAPRLHESAFDFDSPMTQTNISERFVGPQEGFLLLKSQGRQLERRGRAL
jgi:hypothetical protein